MLVCILLKDFDKLGPSCLVLPSMERHIQRRRFEKLKNKSLESEENFIEDDIHPKGVGPVGLNRREASSDQLKHQHHLRLIPEIRQPLRSQHAPA